MKKFVSIIDRLPKIVKIIFALPMLDIVWAIYRICKSAIKKNTLGIVLGIVMIFLGSTILWVLDLITIILKGKVLWID